ncbi:hypothetical protein CROQUDRAFT_95867 [Cronartium quercuum f. sp. fusiforme G11]|uniref:Uncharacterized protein n=1 Tax=Cronartium quercuum f. sp. fusiforme G11 TaxID=708437 RepID=A0A9P6NBW9_9BASI|nr:hypothetical protein CROQUDRAFT_95867 [Cronartium quercuum f. sp. fusiforme G11]
MPGNLPAPASSTAALQGVPPPDNGIIGQQGSQQQHKQESASRPSGHPYAIPSQNYGQRASYGLAAGEDFPPRGWARTGSVQVICSLPPIQTSWREEQAAGSLRLKLVVKLEDR